MKELLHEQNQRWLSAFKQRPHHAVVAELNHTAEYRAIVDIISRQLAVAHPIEVNLDEALTIEDIRNMQRVAKLRKTNADRQLFVLNTLPGISGPAQNSLLKLLEEPPSNTFFLIIVDNMMRLLPTIYSRAVVLHILPLATQQFERIIARQTTGGGNIKALGALFNNSFAAAMEAPTTGGSFDQARAFLGASYAGRLRQLANLKERAAAEQFVNELLVLASQTQLHTASANKRAATAQWLSITKEGIATLNALKHNGNVTLHLQRLAMHIGTQKLTA